MLEIKFRNHREPQANYSFVYYRISSSGMWRCVGPGLSDVSEERIASIFRVEKSASGEPASAGGCRQQNHKYAELGGDM
jgi:hypothetical protein